jgi:hypothetical protein
MGFPGPHGFGPFVPGPNNGQIFMNMNGMNVPVGYNNVNMVNSPNYHHQMPMNQPMVHPGQFAHNQQQDHFFNQNNSQSIPNNTHQIPSRLGYVTDSTSSKFNNVGINHDGISITVVGSQPLSLTSTQPTSLTKTLTDQQPVTSPGTLPQTLLCNNVSTDGLAEDGVKKAKGIKFPTKRNNSTLSIFLNTNLEYKDADNDKIDVINNNKNETIESPIPNPNPSATPDSSTTAISGLSSDNILTVDAVSTPPDSITTNKDANDHS